MEAYMTAKEAAEYLKLAERTLVRLAHEGKIPGVKIGGQWRFRRARPSGDGGAGVLGRPGRTAEVHAARGGEPMQPVPPW